MAQRCHRQRRYYSQCVSSFGCCPDCGSWWCVRIIGEEKALSVKVGTEANNPSTEDVILVRGVSAEVDRAVKDILKIVEDAKNDIILSSYVRPTSYLVTLNWPVLYQVAWIRDWPWIRRTRRWFAGFRCQQAPRNTRCQNRLFRWWRRYQGRGQEEEGSDSKIENYGKSSSVPRIKTNLLR